MCNTLVLLERAHKGDKKARDCLFEQNTGLICMVIRRFSGRGVEMEDLYQIGSIGLLKAIDRFDSSFEVQFSTYAIPMISGEIRRFFRDDGILKVSRNVKENQFRIYQARQTLQDELKREPTLDELCVFLNMKREDVILALEAFPEVESLQKPVCQKDGSAYLLEERLADDKNRPEGLLDRIYLEEMLSELPSRERKLIYMRYFQNMTQTEIAEKLAISQVQVSRLEKKILLVLRGKSGSD